MVLIHTLHGHVHLLVRHGHTQPPCARPVAPVILRCGRHLLDGVLDDTLHGHRVDHEAEVHVALRARVHRHASIVLLVMAHLLHIAASMLRLGDDPMLLRLSRWLLRILLPSVRRRVLPELLRLLASLRCLALRLVAARPAPQHVLQLWLLLLQLLQLLLHLLLVLQRLEGRHLVRVRELALHLGGLSGLQHHLLRLLHRMRCHLLLPNDYPLVVINAWHVYHLRLELA